MKSNQHLDVCMDTLALVGDVWVLAIVNQLATHPRRFGQLQHSVPKLNAVTLQKRLRLLEKGGFIARSVGTHDKQSVEYQLTRKGLLFVPVIESLRELSQKLSA